MSTPADISRITRTLPIPNAFLELTAS